MQHSDINQNTQQHLLVIGYVWPEPNSSAAGSRMLQIIQAFQSKGWRVTFSSPAEISVHACDLQTLNIQQQSIELNCASFDEFVSELKPDAVMFDRFMMEEQFGWRVAKHCPSAVRILDMEDVHSLRQARHQAIKQGIAIEQSNLHTDEAIREMASIFRCDLTLVISEFEVQLLQHHYRIPSTQLLYLPFMVTNQAIVARPKRFDERQHFVSIGNFRHAPNWDAVLELKRLWPSIRRECPNAELHIYGAYPPKKATQLHNEAQGFLVKGWVEDALSTITNHRVLLAPLRFGAGLKGKLLDAMLTHTPSVTSPIGAEGMSTPSSWPGAVCHSDEQFVQQAIALYNDNTIWSRAIDTVPQHLRPYEASHLVSELCHRVADICANLDSHRQQHFIGAMLMHHTLKSTQYMAQWIEAKNKH
ncbi:glycosyltransferase [Echinimonas agarilytica]|uniref:Glycosyltransferase n=1 Tax=Echinimonas agarilytica TaxID=1215918 RepID=A0AA41W8T8_9GAMM|nr:glycosyltransferase family 4 protein [Echinimonas agarilytica]MCM2680657.1 glycosyltransferase [Echinimonas agarilytica]